MKKELVDLWKHCVNKCVSFNHNLIELSYEEIKILNKEIQKQTANQFSNVIIKKVYKMQKVNPHTERGRKGEIGWLNLNCEDVVNMIREELNEFERQR